jgi:hypothetical protein
MLLHSPAFVKSLSHLPATGSTAAEELSALWLGGAGLALPPVDDWRCLVGVSASADDEAPVQQVWAAAGAAAVAGLQRSYRHKHTFLCCDNCCTRVHCRLLHLPPLLVPRTYM